MMPKRHKQSLSAAWIDLQQRILALKNLRDPSAYLGTLRDWLQDYKTLLGPELEARQGMLRLLLDGGLTDCAAQDPLKAIHWLRMAILNNPFPERLQTTVSRLDAIIYELVVYTEMQDCPRCHEGYLGYWFSPGQNRFYLDCPECGWGQTLSGETIAEPVKDLRPATLTDLQQLH